MSTEQANVAAATPASATSDTMRAKSFDYAYTNDDGIKESFLIFSGKINELDRHLGRFANDCLRLGRVAGLLLAIKSAREMLRRTREVFFRNATALVPDLYGLAHKNCNSAVLDPNSEHYYIPLRYFTEPLPPFDALPTALEQLAAAFSLLHLRIDEFREFTDEGLLLKSLLLTLERDLMYRASCARVYSGRLNTPPIQRYIHQFLDELESDFEKVTAALGEFTVVGISAINHEQERSSQNLTSILTVATFFSGVTAGTLGMATGASDQNTTMHVASMLWFASLVFSVGAALNSLLAMAWKSTRSGSRGGKPPFWVTMWIDGSQLLFLGIAIVTFSAGIIVFAFSSSQAFYTPYVTVGSTAVTFIGLVAILIWMLYEILVSPVLKQQQADIIKSSGESVHSDLSKTSLLHGGITDALSNAFYSLGFQHRSPSEDDVEKVDEKASESGESPSQEQSLSGRMKAKLQGNVKSVGMLNTTLGAFIPVGRQHKRSHHKGSLSPKSKLHIDTTGLSGTPMTQLILPSEPALEIELLRYGFIHDVAYSEDGKWLAVTCAKENTHQSWTTVYNAETLTTLMDTWHEGRVISERLIWSPSGTKLIVKFEHRFDVWDLDAKALHVIERHHQVQDVEWCEEDTFLVAEHSCVFKMNLTGLMAVYRFEHMHVRSIGFDRKNNYLILITRVAKSPEQFEPASGRSEKRIVVYDMEKQQSIYQVPVLENISSIHPIAGELDILITHKDQKAFQLWSLDAGIKGAEITARLKKRTITPHFNVGDYVGPTCIGGNYSQFILNVTTSGEIDIWRRESGAPHQRFKSPILQEEGVRCFSWRRSTDGTATFATAGIDSHTLRVWRGEEPLLPKTPTSIDSVIRPLAPKPAPTRGMSKSRWQRAAHVRVASSSDSPSPPEVERIEEALREN